MHLPLVIVTVEIAQISKNVDSFGLGDDRFHFHNMNRLIVPAGLV
jgi:hypothetical protein